MFSLEYAGINAFDVRTRRGGFCGIIVQSKRGDWQVFFNFTATKGSQRKFQTAQDAIAFIYDRRIKKGYGV